MSESNDSAQDCPSINADGMTVLFDKTSASDNGVDFVFIHGLNGHPRQTWTHPKGFYWPWELRTHLTHSRVMTFGYIADVNSDLATNFMRIENVSSKLLNALANKRWQANAINRPIVFIGHSLGGLVAKTAAVTASRYIASKANDLDKLYNAMRGFVFFGVPHGGSSVLGMKRVWVIEKMAKAAFAEIPPKLEEALKSGSDELIDLADSFRLLSICVEYRIVMINFFEAMSTVGLGTRVVDEAAAATHYAKANPPEPINADHIGMVKFESAGNSTFQNVSEQLRRLEARLEERESSWDGDDLEHVYDSLAFPQMFERWEGIDDPHEKTFEWIMNADIVQRQLLPTVMGPSLQPSIEHLTESTEPESHLSTPRASFQDQRQHRASNPFIKWLRTDDAPIFWVSGKAASGKSTLMKYLHKRPELTTILLEEYAKGINNLIMASFFFYDQGKSALQRSREGLLRALLHRLLRDNREMWHDVFDEKCRKIFKRYGHREKTLKERLSKPIVHWSWTELRDLFGIFAAKKPSRIKVFLLIDGLDEFRLVDDFGDYLEYEDDETSEQARRNIAAHRNIAEFFLDLSSLPGFKMCLSGRPVQALDDSFSKFPGFKLQELTMDDIRQFVEDRLGNHPRTLLLSEIEPSRTSAVVREVCSKANGVFLWVRLVVNILVTALEAGDGLGQLEEKVDKLPPGLAPLYAKMMASVLPEYREEGIALFCRVLAARSLLTGLTLSFSQETPSFAVACPAGRLTERSEQFKVDEVLRRLKSRCGGLLESGPNPALVIVRVTDEHERAWNSIAWTRRPHIAIAPVVTFVHRTAIEYLQSSYLQSRMDHVADIQLLVSCVLRIKLIGLTMHPWEICHAVKDAVFYAKRIEKEAGFSPLELLDEIDAAMREIWSRAMSAGRREDHDKDPGYGPEVCKTRERKKVPVGPIFHGYSIWGPIFDVQSPLDDQDTILTVAVQGELILYLEEKMKQHGPAILKRPGRPLLAYAVVPRSHRSIMDYFPTSDEIPTAMFSPPHLVEWLIRHGASPNEVYHGRKIWHEALQNQLTSLDDNEQNDKKAIENFCAKTADWAKTMSLLVENGADVVSKMANPNSGMVPRTPLEYLFPYWARYSLDSEPIRVLFAKVFQKAASEGAISRDYRNFTTDMILKMDLKKLEEVCRIKPTGSYAFHPEGKGAERPKAFQASTEGVNEDRASRKSVPKAQSQPATTHELVDTHHDCANFAEPQARWENRQLNTASPSSHRRSFDSFKRHILKVTSRFRRKPRSDRYEPAQGNTILTSAPPGQSEA